MTGFALNRLMVVMNRSIPVAIAIYRYALVFYYDVMYDNRQQKWLPHPRDDNSVRHLILLDTLN